MKALIDHPGYNRLRLEMQLAASRITAKSLLETLVAELIANHD